GPAAAVGGIFNVTIDVPGQPLTGSMSFNVQGQALTGNLTTQLGTAPIRNGRVTGNRFSFDATVAYGGANIDIQVSGTVTGNRIEGSIDSPQGAVPFSGTRVP
ncbi:MAG TPA: hypothetical protein PKE66_06130, partial [Pyrinomonadaceae bacterium]|nr:hypothetical protein [Pyrinomonadaceae bacterium]